MAGRHATVQLLEQLVVTGAASTSSPVTMITSLEGPHGAVYDPLKLRVAPAAKVLVGPSTTLVTPLTTSMTPMPLIVRRSGLSGVLPWLQFVTLPLNLMVPVPLLLSVQSPGEHV